MLKIENNCYNFKNLPNIEIILKSRRSYKNKELKQDKIILRPEDYIIDGRRIKNSVDIESKEKDTDFIDLLPKIDCQPAFMPIDVPAPRGPIFVFGEYFLRKFYTVFDRDENVLGFTESNQSVGDVVKNIKTPYETQITEGVGDGLHGRINEERLFDTMNIPNGVLKTQSKIESDSEFFKNVNLFDESLDNIDNESIPDKIDVPTHDDFFHEKEKFENTFQTLNN